MRGDDLRKDRNEINSKISNGYASDLVKQIKNMNEGKYLEPLINPTKSDFCVGVSGYPEKHFEAIDFKTDIKYLKEKVENGADYIVTQMFFDNKVYFDFVERCRKEGINIPIIPGIKILSTERHLTASFQNIFIFLYLKSSKIPLREKQKMKYVIQEKNGQLIKFKSCSRAALPAYTFILWHLLNFPLKLYPSSSN